MGSGDFGEKVKKNVAANFDRSLAIYQAFEDKHGFFAALSAELARWVGVRPGSAILDVGCGNGISARVLSEQFGCTVLGVDLSPAMVAAGRADVASRSVELVVGDGERLVEVAAGRRFDFVLYNASLFIFPDAERSLQEAAACLEPGGKIAFSFYPNLTGPDGADLLDLAFDRLGEARPRFRVITDYDKACQALARIRGPVAHHHWIRPLDTDFLIDFFSIPAQSASLFPALDYPARCEKVQALFAGLADFSGCGSVVWRMAADGGREQGQNKLDA